jgi:hypothetical protein
MKELDLTVELMLHLNLPGIVPSRTALGAAVIGEPGELRCKRSGGRPVDAYTRKHYHLPQVRVTKVLELRDSLLHT